MVRPCFLVIDPEHSGSISTRKLIIETAKLNVITAYSGAEAIETVRKFPAVDGIVCNTELRDMPVAEVIGAIKVLNRGLPVILVGPENRPELHAADYHVGSFEPKRLLEVLQRICPEEASAISDHEDHLRDDE